MKILFMGSPNLAVPSLQALLDSEHRIIGVVTQPDKPAGRGRALTPPPVAVLAREKGIPLFQPASLRNNLEFMKTLRGLAPDLIAIVAYGKILPKEILDLPTHKCVNLHFSLLPKYRGAAPVQWALINDEEETGITTFRLVEKVDAGPVYLKKKIPIGPEDNAESLGHRLAVAGSHLLIETIEAIRTGEVDPVPQNERQATYAPPLRKEEGRIDWTRKAATLQNQIRGMTPWPGAFTLLDGKILKIHGADTVSGKRTAAPGEVITSEEPLEVACGDGALLLKEVQLEGKKKMDIVDFLKGHPIPAGKRLGKP